MRHIDSLAALVLNADYRPHDIWSWREAIESVVHGSTYQIAAYDEVVRSPSTTMPIPSVVVLKRYVPTNRPAAYTRRNVFLAYAQPGPTGPRWLCALCGKEAEQSDLTFDHIVPRSRGGRSSYENICLAHAACNGRKGDQTLKEAGMRLHVKLVTPTCDQINRAKLKIRIGRPREPWSDYFLDSYWDVPLEA